MAKATLQQIQDQIAFELTGNASVNDSDADWGHRLSPINRSLFDWAYSYDWEVLKEEFNGLISTSTGNASLALPSDFEKLDGYPRITHDGTNTDSFSAIDISKRAQYVDSDRWVSVLGNNAGGRVMYIHATTLASGASVQFTYYSSPASLASATDLVACPDPSYITQRSLYYIYKSQEDSLFQEAKVESDKILARLIENENAFGLASKQNTVQNDLVSKYNFRIGRD